ncbi:CHC2 zinc finger domain-containing protein [Tautonia rosea]|uniref:CHC2 zinc finger domain-containing protein n=1 Tax=Tautonia rosea TaxID=2728037 RepID=UPI001475D098|nr:CHC2 zinc finger domain-containing protein [Tautonia rosea]
MIWTMTATGPPRGRIDWQELRDRIDLAAVATALMGEAPGRRGERGRRLWWPCPFHDDQNPSFAIDPSKPFWKCYGCNERGDAANLVMLVRSCSFPEAVKWLADFAGGAIPYHWSSDRAVIRSKPKAPPRPPSGPEGMTADEADRLVAEASDRLWSRSGADALDDLRSRGLDDEAIRAARLGFDPSVQATTRDGRPYRASGIVIPWVEQNRLSLIKVRQPEGRKPKYAEVYRHNPSLYVAAPILPGRPVIVTEGELDALLVSQQTAHLTCGVVTTGSASNRPDRATVARLLPAPVWIIATDADEAGDRLADAWVELAPGRCRRARPPGPGKDWTDAHAAGSGRVAYHLAPLVMTPPSWEELAEAESIDATETCLDAIANGFTFDDPDDLAEAEARCREKGEQP